MSPPLAFGAGAFASGAFASGKFAGTVADPIKALFAGGAQGVWFDNTAGTLFEDEAATVPATTGGPVWTRLDRSGNGNHQKAPFASARPTLQADGFLLPDYSTQRLEVNIANPLTPTWTIVCAMKRGPNTGFHNVVQVNANSSVTDYIRLSGTTSERFRAMFSATSISATSAFTLSANNTFPPDIAIVATAIFRPTPGNIEHRLSGDGILDTNAVASTIPADMSLGTSIEIESAGMAQEAFLMVIDRELDAAELAFVQAAAATAAGLAA